MYANLAIDWTINLTAILNGRLSTSPQLSMSRALAVRCKLLVENRNPWTWLNNSCHMDCWLMIELACFSQVAQTTSLLTNRYVENSPALMKLVRVLLTAGDNNTQDNAKMAYWAMEIEDYHNGTNRYRRTFGQPICYQNHYQLLNTQMGNEEGNNEPGDPVQHDLFTTHIGFAPACSNEEHVDVPKILKPRNVVTVSEHWYSMPQDWTRVRGPNKTFTFPTCAYVVHKSLADVAGTLIGRTDGETIDCKACYNKDKSCYQITQIKHPETTLLPLFLEFEVDTQLTVPAQRLIKIGSTLYTLMGVVFHGNNHYICNVFLDTMWYHYDGMGLKSIAANAERGWPSAPRMTRISSPNTFMTPPEKRQGFKPVSYRYMRKHVTSLGHQQVQADLIPTDYQFDNMKRLMS